MSACLCVCLPHQAQIFLGLSLAFRSPDQFQASHWSSLTPPPMLPPPSPHSSAQKNNFWTTQKIEQINLQQIGIGVPIRIGQQVHYLPYAAIFLQHSKWVYACICKLNIYIYIFFFSTSFG